MKQDRYKRGQSAWMIKMVERVPTVREVKVLHIGERLVNVRDKEDGEETKLSARCLYEEYDRAFIAAEKLRALR